MSSSSKLMEHMQHDNCDQLLDPMGIESFTVLNWAIQRARAHQTFSESVLVELKLRKALLVDEATTNMSNFLSWYVPTVQARADADLVAAQHSQHADAFTERAKLALRELDDGCSWINQVTGALRNVNGARMRDGTLVVSNARLERPNDVHAESYWRHFVDVYNTTTNDLQNDVPLKALRIESLAPKSMQELRSQVPGVDAATTLRNAMRLFAERPALGEENAGDWRWESWNKIQHRSESIARELLGELPHGSFVGFYGANSIDWLVAFFAALLGRFVVVPIHRTASQSVLTHIVNEADLAIVFTDSLSHEFGPARVVRLNEIGDGSLASLEKLGQVALENKTKSPVVVSAEEDPLMVLYTSGSTGTPKGATLSNGAFNSQLIDRLTKRGALAADVTEIDLLTSLLSTSAAPRNLLANLCGGGRAALVQNLARIYDVLPVVAPTSVAVVPMFLQLLYNNRELHSVDNNLVLGHRLKSITVGGATPNPTVLKWVRSLYPHATVQTTYGASEVGGITEADGFLRENVELRLEDFEDYRGTDQPFPRGEILVRTRGMISGYLHRPEATQSSFEPDGFFRTGDIGELIGPRQIRIIDRKAALFKLSNGEWVSPERIEASLSSIGATQQVFVHGDSAHGNLVAVAVSHSAKPDIIDAWASVAASMRHFEMPVRLFVTAEPWTEANNLLTASGKLCRWALRERFRAELQEMMADLPAIIDSDIVQQAVRVLKDGTDQKAWEAIPLESILAVQVAAVLKQEFGVALPVAALLQDFHVSELSAHVRGESKLELDAVWSLETMLESEIKALPSGQGRGILLTGATGHVGAAVLHRLLSRGVSPVYALIRGETREEAEQRLADTFRIRGYGGLGRTIVLQSDISRPRLGLDDASAAHVYSDIRTIIHSAARVDHLRSYQTLRSANVDSVRELLRIATTGFGKHLIFLSTESVGNKLPDGAGGYVQSKWVAEQLVASARLRGINAHIVRLGLIGFDRRTGAANTEDWVSRFIAGCLQLGQYYVADDGLLRLSFVDDVANAVVDSAMAGRSENLIMTLPSNVISSPELMRTISTVVGPPELDFVPRCKWNETLSRLPETNPMFPLRQRYAAGLPRMHPEGTPYTLTADAVGRFVRFLSMAFYTCRRRPH